MEVFYWARMVNLHLVGVDHDGRHVAVLDKQSPRLWVDIDFTKPPDWCQVLPVPHHGAVQAPAGVEDNLDRRAQSSQQ